jgi:hypothetical protein
MDRGLQASKQPLLEHGRVFLMQNIVLSHQGNSARGTGRLVLLQNSLPWQPGRLCRLPEKILLLQIHLRQPLRRAFLMQINSALLRKSPAG